MFSNIRSTTYDLLPAAFLVEPWIVSKRCSILYFITGCPLRVFLSIFSRIAFLRVSACSLSSLLTLSTASLSILSFSFSSCCFLYSSSKLKALFFLILLSLLSLYSSVSFTLCNSKQKLNGYAHQKNIHTLKSSNSWN